MFEITVREKETGKVLLEKEGTVLAGVLCEGSSHKGCSVGNICFIHNATFMEIASAIKVYDSSKEKLVESFCED